MRDAISIASNRRSLALRFASRERPCSQITSPPIARDVANAPLAKQQRAEAAPHAAFQAGGNGSVSLPFAEGLSRLRLPLHRGRPAVRHCLRDPRNDLRQSRRRAHPTSASARARCETSAARVPQRLAIREGCDVPQLKAGSTNGPAPRATRRWSRRSLRKANLLPLP